MYLTSMQEFIEIVRFSFSEIANNITHPTLCLMRGLLFIRERGFYLHCPLRKNCSMSLKLEFPTSNYVMT